MQTILLLSWLMQIQINVGLPTIRFETAPQVVEVQPGVWVVPDRDDEVFYSDGWYWTRWSDGRWYRTRNHRGGWVYVAPPAVPVMLARVPPGQYKHHHGKPDRMRVINPDGTVTEYKVKEKHGVLEVKGKGKEWKGKDKDKEWKGNHGKGHGHH